MRNTRVYIAGVVLGATVVATAWLFTYRAWEVRLVRDHGVVVDTVEMRVRPWWAVLAAYSLPLIGTALSLWVLPEGRRLTERVVARVGASLSPKPSQ